MLPKKEIQALFKLLDDPDEEVFDTVSQQLLQYGKEIIPGLEHLWEVTEDESVQDRITQLIHRVYFGDLQAEFKDWLLAEEPELLRGAILVAKYQYPEMNIPFLLTQFEQIRKNLWLELNNYLTPLEKINIFNGILYNYYKFQGHELSDKQSEHFFINRLLEGKQGNALSIGVLYVALARLLDVPIFAINIPKQFLLGYVDTLQHFFTKGNDALRRISFFIDPMNGMVYTQNDVDFYLHKLNEDATDPIHYQEQNAIHIVYRMLEELRKCLNKDLDKVNELSVLMGYLEERL